jgi:hypothetical protein
MGHKENKKCANNISNKLNKLEKKKKQGITCKNYIK